MNSHHCVLDQSSSIHVALKEFCLVMIHQGKYNLIVSIIPATVIVLELHEGILCPLMQVSHWPGEIRSGERSGPSDQ